MIAHDQLLADKFTPMSAYGSSVYLAANAGGFYVRGCPEPEALASLIVTACNAYGQMTADLEAERARSALLAASLKQANAESAQLSEALDRIAKLYEQYPDANAADHANSLYDARCIARTALTAVGVL
ncbi:hypothetical protein [Massilia pseudoviolaceinigra]|uniref:hypothetical protein n=1 Tax=Massilia pseudoviolaceinigra TaxID=3057165 RepID=UPI0027966D54|nr:hypothetical protein [Massilia sp. CCM 9206]MDQ1921688.1 hypothetical protein [Massilia sp. CCM 9206]